MSLAQANFIASEEAVTFWEKIGQGSRMGQYITNIERKMILEAVEIIQPPETALEVGCDGGRWSQMLTELGWRMACTDVNAESLSLCQERIPSAECILVDPDQTTLPCETGSMKLLLCIEVRNAIESDWFLSEAARVLRRGGIFVGVYWNSHSFRGWFSRLRNKKSPNAADATYYQGKPYGAFKEQVGQECFNIIQEKGLCWLPFSRASNSGLISYCAQVEKIMRLGNCVRTSPWVIFSAMRE